MFLFWYRFSRTTRNDWNCFYCSGFVKSFSLPFYRQSSFRFRVKYSILTFLTNISLYTVLMDWEEDDDISGPDSADDSDPEKLESKEKKAKKLDAFLTRSGESIDKKEETGEYTAEEAIVAKNRLDLTYRKPHNKLVEEVKRIKNRREIESKLENQEEEEEEEVP